jgi:hypothetical protein
MDADRTFPRWLTLTVWATGMVSCGTVAFTVGVLAGIPG